MRSISPLKVFVGGEVGTPGVFDMPGDINSLQAVIQAGGFKSLTEGQRVQYVTKDGPKGPQASQIQVI